MADETSLVIKFENKSPVELLDLTASLSALGKQYIDFVSSKGFDSEPGNVRLYISELRTGSIIAVLKDWADQASFMYHHREVLAAFLANFDDIVKFLIAFSPAKETAIAKQEVERVAQILEPIAKDGGSQLFIQITGDNNTVVFSECYGSERAKAVQDGARRFLGPKIPSQGFFENELLYLKQVRDDVHGRAGDRGIIENFSDRPVKLLFLSDEAKRTILERPHPFKDAFLVDGQVSTVEGIPTMYKIFMVREVIERD